MPTGLKFSYRINWGDGSSIQRVTNSTNQTHTYVSTGTYRIKITGICENLNFSFNTALRRIHSSDGLGFKGDIGLRSLNFYYCANLYGEFPTGLKNLQHLESFYLGFNNAPNIGKNAIGGVVTYSIPSNLFERCARLKDIAGVFSATSITSIPLGLFDPLVNLIDARAIFQACTGLTTIPVNLFRYNTNVAYYGRLFKDCTNLTGNIPENLFGETTDSDINTLTSFSDSGGVFTNCTKLYGAIPTGLLKRFTKVTSVSGLFSGCTSLGRNMYNGIPTHPIPSDFFTNNPELTNVSYAFNGCTGLSGDVNGLALPRGLFNNNRSVTTYEATFMGCTGLTGTIPGDLFNLDASASITSTVDFSTEYRYGVFQGCTGLTRFEDNRLFAKYKGARDMSAMFGGCTGLYGGYTYIEDGKTYCLPYGMFANNTSMRSCFELFKNCQKLGRDTSSTNYAINPPAYPLPPKFLSYSKELNMLEAAFHTCTGIKGHVPNVNTHAIPEDLFVHAGDDLTTPSNPFYNGWRFACNYNASTAMGTGGGIFTNCTGLNGSIPANLFNKYVGTGGTSPFNVSFAGVFHNCTGLTGTIPSTLFKYNVNVGSITGTSITGFYGTFSGCTGLTGPIPDVLFDTCATALNFGGTFNGCTGLSGPIPTDLFKNCTNALDFGNTFIGCTGLGRHVDTGTPTYSIPTDLFKNCTTALSFYHTFNGCTGLNSSGQISSGYDNGYASSYSDGLALPRGLFNNNRSVATYEGTFLGCTGLTGTIPGDLFNLDNSASITSTVDFSGTYSNGVFQGCTGLTRFEDNRLFAKYTKARDMSAMFGGCTGLYGGYTYNDGTGDKTYCLPYGMFANNTSMRSCYELFKNCHKLGRETNSTNYATNPPKYPLPPKFLSYSRELNMLEAAFHTCTGIKGYVPNVNTYAIPEDLFVHTGADLTTPPSPSYNGWRFACRHTESISMGTGGGIFTNCTGLNGSIPANLFNKYVGTPTFNVSFVGVFHKCTGLTGTIPSNLFKYNDIDNVNVNVGSIPFESLNGFHGTFSGCTGLSGPIPTGLFDKCPNALNFGNTFNGCTGLTGLIPNDLFYNNKNVTTYSSTFKNCKNLVLPARLFDTTPTYLNKVTDWTSFMEVASTADTFTETIQEVWLNHTMPQSQHDKVFRNQTSLTNYASIPADWK
jgi:hypothetical protein